MAVTKRFYLDYVGCALDWEEGERDRPVYLRVSRGELLLHLPSHHDDGTPGSAVLVETRGVDALWAELRDRDYPFLNPASSRGRVEGRSFN